MLKFTSLINSSPSVRILFWASVKLLIRAVTFVVKAELPSLALVNSCLSVVNAALRVA